MARRRILAVVFAFALVVGCSSHGPDIPDTAGIGGPLDVTDITAPEPTLPVTVLGADGRSVTITDISGIVPLFTNLAETVFELGLGDHVIARDVSTTFDEAADLPLVTRQHEVNAEAILALGPTLVLADEENGPATALDHLRNVGVPVLVIDRPRTIPEGLDVIRTVAKALGVASAGEQLAARTSALIDEVAATAPRWDDPPRVAYLYVRGQVGVSLLGGPRSGPDALIERVGAVDAGTAMGLKDPFTPITPEAMIDAAPEVILVSTSGLESVGGISGLLEMPGVAQTPAAANRRVIAIEDGLLFGFGERTPQALAQLIEGLTGR